MRGVRVCDVNPWAGGEGGAERREAGEEVGNGFFELAGAEVVFVGVEARLFGHL